MFTCWVSFEYRIKQQFFSDLGRSKQVASQKSGTRSKTGIGCRLRIAPRWTGGVCSFYNNYNANILFLRWGRERTLALQKLTEMIVNHRFINMVIRNECAPMPCWNISHIFKDITHTHARKNSRCVERYPLQLTLNKLKTHWCATVHFQNKISA